ncbi:MAG: acetolactate synthase [Thaumarchaeota archaeon]|nr:MAG: acetolactate synthase [Nitrososphaerota archaeon]
MKISDYVAQFLEQNQIKFIFEMSGGMITRLLDSIYQKSKITIISFRHEQSAAFAADAYGRLTGIPGIALATSGPGATNLITGIGSSYFDSSPTIFITGQVNRNEIKGDKKVRQLGFQETDIVSIVRPITKKASLIINPNDVPNILKDAFVTATEKRPGPVIIDIPMDVQREFINVDKIEKITSKIIDKKLISSEISIDIINSIKKAKRPIILVGGGIHSSNSLEKFRDFVRIVKIPVVNSLMAVDALPYLDKFRVGLIGSYGNRWANLALSKSDLLIVLGSRLDIRQTSSKVEEFAKNKKIFHVDVDTNEVNNRIKGCIEISMNLESFFDSMSDKFVTHEFTEKHEWINKINEIRKQFPDTDENIHSKGINPNLFIHQLSDVSQSASVFVTDVGQHQMWAAQSLKLGGAQRFITSGGMGSMGFGLPASIGAALANSSSPVVLIAGDGGFQSNIQELQTVIHNKLPIKIIVINNNCHGMVRQFQEEYFDRRYQSTLWGYSAPNFELIANAYGISSRTITEQNEVFEALKWFWNDTHQPVLLQVMIDTFTNALPKIAFGKPNYIMDPKKD